METSRFLERFLCLIFFCFLTARLILGFLAGDQVIIVRRQLIPPFRLHILAPRHSNYICLLKPDEIITWAGLPTRSLRLPLDTLYSKHGLNRSIDTTYFLHRPNRFNNYLLKLILSIVDLLRCGQKVR